MALLRPLECIGALSICGFVGAIYVDGGFSAVRRVHATKWPLPDDLSAVLPSAVSR